MQPIDNILSERMNKLGLKKTLDAARIIAIANRLAAGRFKALNFSRAVLTVSCPNSIAAQEVQMAHRQIIADLNQHLGQPTIKRLRFKVNSVN